MRKADADAGHSQPPVPLAVLLLRWFGFGCCCISLWWFLTERPPVEQLVAVAFLGLGAYTIVIVRFATDREKARQDKRIRQMERELRIQHGYERDALKRVA